MLIRMPDSLPYISLARFLAEHQLVLVPDGAGNFSAIPNAIQRAEQAKAERRLMGASEFVS